VQPPWLRRSSWLFPIAASAVFHERIQFLSRTASRLARHRNGLHVLRRTRSNFERSTKPAIASLAKLAAPLLTEHRCENTMSGLRAWIFNGERPMQDNEPLFAKPSRAPAPLPQVRFAEPSASRRTRTLRTVCIALGCVLGVTVVVAGVLYYSPSQDKIRVDNGRRSGSATKRIDDAPRADSQEGSSSAKSPSDSTGSSPSSLTNTPSATSATPTRDRGARKNQFTPTASPYDTIVPPVESPAPQPQSTASADSAVAGTLEQLEDEAGKLNARAAAISRSLDTLRQQQNASGLDLRADISSAQDRMQRDLSLADSALQQRNPASAQKYLGQAEGELSILERFLNQ
jgi:hypothetical protein